MLELELELELELGGTLSRWGAGFLQTIRHYDDTTILRYDGCIIFVTTYSMCDIPVQLPYVTGSYSTGTVQQMYRHDRHLDPALYCRIV